MSEVEEDPLRASPSDILSASTKELERSATGVSDFCHNLNSVVGAIPSATTTTATANPLRATVQCIGEGAATKEEDASRGEYKVPTRI